MAQVVVHLCIVPGIYDYDHDHGFEGPELRV